MCLDTEPKRALDVRRRSRVIEMKLEVVPVHVDDIDVAKVFYTHRLGWTADHDFSP